MPELRYFHRPTRESPRLLKHIPKIYGLRKQIFASLDAISIASLIEVTYLKPSISPLERARCLSPFRAICTEAEVKVLKKELALCTSHQTVIWGNVDQLLAAIRYPSKSYPINKISIYITEVSTDNLWLQNVKSQDTFAQTAGVITEHRRARIQQSTPELHLPGNWTRVPNDFITRASPKAHAAISGGRLWPKLLGPDNRSQILPNNIHLSWPRTTFTADVLDRFEYMSMDWSIVQTAAEQLSLHTYFVKKTSQPYPSVFVMSSCDMVNMHFDVAQEVSRSDPKYWAATGESIPPCLALPREDHRHQIELLPQDEDFDTFTRHLN